MGMCIIDRPRLDDLRERTSAIWNASADLMTPVSQFANNIARMQVLSASLKPFILC